MPDTRHWHVTLTLTGESNEPMMLRAALTRLSQEHALLDSVRYARDTAEITYWDQGESMLDVASLALRMWDEHRESAHLPRWSVTGLEIVDERTHHRRRGSGADPGAGGASLTPLTM